MTMTPDQIIDNHLRSMRAYCTVYLMGALCLFPISWVITSSVIWILAFKLMGIGAFQNWVLIIVAGVFVTMALYPLSINESSDASEAMHEDESIMDHLHDRAAKRNVNSIVKWIGFSWALSMRAYVGRRNDMKAVMIHREPISRALELLIKRNERVPIGEICKSDDDLEWCSQLMAIKEVLYVCVNGPHLKIRNVYN